MKDPVRNQGFNLRSLRARTAESRYGKSKAQSVIYEDREIAQGVPEEVQTLLELGEGSSWRIIVPEVLLGTASNSFILYY